MNTTLADIAKPDVHTIVTNHVISLLEKDIIPWHTSCVKAGIPRNLINDQLYTGLNAWLLASAGYSKNLFLTINQALAVGARLRNGEKGHLVLYLTPGKHLQYYRVYNIAQFEHIDGELIIATEEETKGLMRHCKRIVAAMPNRPGILSESSSVFYRHEIDTIEMPDNEFMTNDETYYSNLFYAMMLSTGHESRLDRTEFLKAMRIRTPKMGTTEELLAEMGSSYLCAYAGISPVHLLWDRFSVEG